MRLRPPARAIAITGFMATGKTTVGRLVAERLGLGHVDTDEMIERTAGREIAEIFASDGEKHFRDLESVALQEALSEQGRVVSTGGGMLLRDSNVEALREAGPIICLTAEPEEILQRTAGDETRPLLQVADPAKRVAELLDARREAYGRADYHVETTGRSAEDVCERVLALLRDDPRARWLTGQRTRVPVDVAGASYCVTVGRGLLGELGELYPAPGSGTCAALVTTDTVGPLYAEPAAEGLGAGGWDVRVLTVPDGEASKSLGVYGELCEEMAAAGLDRGSTVFALGGGVVGDLAGFAAATYMRGIALVHLPTSLLAQVDSSVGGKTAIDLSAGKNLIGAFHQPRAVFADVDTLQTLPEAELRSGLGEIIKHACCFDAEMFDFMAANREAVVGGDGPAREYLVARNCQIKAGVVAEDPTEQGVRVVLNYGHTVGHALERAAPQWGLRHGEVVGIGMAAESRLAVQLGVAAEETARRQRELIEAYGLPTVAEGVDADAAAAALRRDKKIVGGRLRLPLVPRIGSFVIVEDVDVGSVEHALRAVVR
ncbi:MAG: 3-dehydroquinate synthase [Armatimonadota bacterium]